MDWRERYENVYSLRAHKINDESSAQAKEAIWVDLAAWVEQTVPLRPWVAGGYFMRGSVTVISGVGAAGKSMLALGYAIAAAAGKQWGKFAPNTECRVSIYNVEDDADEQRRRISAALRQHDLLPAWTAGKIARLGPTDVGTLFELDAIGITETRVMAALLAHIQEFKPDILVVDPLIELHSAEENDNTALRMVLAKLRALAVAHNMAVVVLHHSRKGLQSPGDPDSLRGASSIVGAARIVLTVCLMSPEEASELNIAEDLRWRFFRVDGAKSNYAPPREAEWYERIDYTLDNGEVVAAAVPWTPPTGRTATVEEVASLDQLVAQGMSDGQPWSPRLCEEARSVSHAMRKLGIDRPADQKKLLKQLYQAGVVSASFKAPRRASSQPLKGLRTPKGMPDHVDWLD